ncbi:hypothetical protein ACFONN_10290 [Dyella humi]|uniref:Lipoprotein n=1 Tax=Dyella humi TaxID=1770547 RepID=A0ABW8IJM8_9GAMM
MKCKHLIAAALTVTCSGCAGIEVSPYSQGKADVKGVPYVLPMTSFTLTITRRVVDCNPKKGGLTPDIQVAITSQTVPDPAARFTLTSDGFFDTSDIKVAYNSSGTTSAINTSTADQTGPLITQAATTVASILPIAIGGSSNPEGSGKGAPSPAPSTVCSKPVITALDKIGNDGDATHEANPGKLKDKVAADTTILNNTNADITLLSTEISTLGKDATPSLRKRLVDLLEDQKKYQDQLSAEQSDLNKYLAVITDTQTVQWPADGQHWESGDDQTLKLSETTWKRWTDGANGKYDPNDENLFQIYLKLERQGSTGQAAKPGDLLAQVDTKDGIPVRFPVQAILHVCRVSACNSTYSNEIAKFPAPVLQFGLIYEVPAKGGIFASTTFALQLDQNGIPTSVEVANQTSVAASAATSASTAATQLAGIPSAINSAKLAKVTAEANIVNEKNLLATNEANATTVSQLASNQADTLLLQAQAAQITAQNTLITAKATDADAAQLAPIQAETNLAQAQTAQLAAAKALVAARQAMGAED